MKNKSSTCRLTEASTTTFFAAELFSQLPIPTQDAIIDLIKSLLSDE